MREFIKQIPVVGDALRRIYWRLLEQRKKSTPFPGSAKYWDERYSAGGDSGAGSYLHLAEFKAEVINGFVAAHHVQSVIEFGCGDGNQLRLAKYPTYLGFDVSAAAVAACRELFKDHPQRFFRSMSEYSGEQADLALSLDVIYHLVEDNVFNSYMKCLFGASTRYVIVYASDSDENRGYEGTHVRHRKFTRWINHHAKDWTLVRQIPNRYPYKGDYRTGSFADFFVYTKSSSMEAGPP
jgi:SAM-dependent methyltransferase